MSHCANIDIEKETLDLAEDAEPAFPLMAFPRCSSASFSSSIRDLGKVAGGMLPYVLRRDWQWQAGVIDFHLT